MSRIPSKQFVVAGERFPKSRALPRYSITALAEVIEPVSKHRISGWTSVINDNGCHVRASDSLAAGTIVQLRIEQDGRTFETWARVANAVPQEGMGLAFFDTAESQRSLLKTWMEKAGIAADRKDNPER
jgi:PilZ domain